MANIVNSGAGANISAEVTVTQGNNNTTVIDAAYKAARDFVDKPHRPHRVLDDHDVFPAMIIR